MSMDRFGIIGLTSAGKKTHIVSARISTEIQGRNFIHSIRNLHENSFGFAQSHPLALQTESPAQALAFACNVGSSNSTSYRCESNGIVQEWVAASVCECTETQRQVHAHL